MSERPFRADDPRIDTMGPDELRKALREALLREEALIQASARDQPTGLLNRQAFEEIVARELARRKAASLGGKRPKPIVVVFVDLDGLKGINDTLGHGAGDRLIAHTARALRNGTRPGDDAARMSRGDEFALLLRDADESGARTTVERIRRMLEDATSTGFQGMTVGLSAGWACWRAKDRNMTVADMIRIADGAMYDDKTTRKTARSP